MAYINKSYLSTQFTNFANRISSVFAKKTEIPTNTSDLNNDSDFISLTNVATQSSNGAMSSSDKKILDNNNKFIYASCNTASATQVKQIVLNNTNQELKDGDHLAIQFYYTNSYNANTTNYVTFKIGDDTYKIFANEAGRTNNSILTGTNTWYYGLANIVHHYVIHKVGTERSLVYICKGSDDNTYDRTRYNVNIKAGMAIVGGNLICGKDGVFKHMKNNTAWDITYPILYSAGNISNGGTSTNNYSALQISVQTTQSITLTAYKPVYVKGKLNGIIFTPVSATPLTQTIPTTEDGYEYIYLGTAYSTTNVYLEPYHPIYEYIGGKFRPYGSYSKLGVSANSATNGNAKIRLTNADGTTNDVTIKGEGNVRVTTNSNGEIVVSLNWGNS